MNLKLESYSKQILNWPSTGKHILAQYDDENIIVYQAYNEKIANSIVKSQNFHSEECNKSGYSMNRMSWIKTNFLWMMFRSGWATKKNQEKILAIKISRQGFEDILLKAKNSNSTTNKLDEVRLQWDPDHKPDGSKVESGSRAIQLGLRGEMLAKFSKEYIVEISDITDFVLQQKENISNLSLLTLPLETAYIITNSELAKHIDLS